MGRGRCLSLTLSAGVGRDPAPAGWGLVLTILQVRNWFQKEAPSSRLNRTPPGGAVPASAP